MTDNKTPSQEYRDGEEEKRATRHMDTYHEWLIRQQQIKELEKSYLIRINDPRT